MPTSALIADYPHTVGGHCGSGALRDLVAWSGLDIGAPVSEGLVFGLGGGLSFSYIRSTGLAPPIYLVGRNADMELSFCDRLGITTRRHQTDDDDVAWAWVREELDAGYPVMVWADIAELPYLRVTLTNTRHDIVVIGYDTDAGTVSVVDNDCEQVQVIPATALRRARNSDGFPDRNRNATYPMRYPAPAPHLLDSARDAAAEAVGHLTNGTGTLFDLDAYPGTVVTASGIAGVSVFADDLAAWPHELDPDQRRAGLQATSIFIEKAGTGGGLFRHLQAGFCHAVADATADRAFRRAGDAYSSCALAWSALAHACRSAQSGSDEVSAVIAAARALPSLETSAVEALERAAGQV